MINCCPKCSFLLDRPLIDGLAICVSCNYLIKTDKINNYLSIFRHIKKTNTTNINQLKSELKCRESEVIFVLAFAVENEFSFEEFEKELPHILM